MPKRPRQDDSSDESGDQAGPYLRKSALKCLTIARKKARRVPRLTLNESDSVPKGSQEAEAAPSKEPGSASYLTQVFQKTSLDTPEYFPHGRVSTGDYQLLDALCTQTDVMLLLTTKFLDPKSLLSLYSIHKPFHILVNCNLTTYMTRSARHWCQLYHPRIWDERSTDREPLVDQEGYTVTPPPMPFEPLPPGKELMRIVPFRCFRHLCVRDPTGRLLSPELQPADKNYRKHRLLRIPDMTYLSSAFINTTINSPSWPPRGPGTPAYEAAENDVVHDPELPAYRPPEQVRFVPSFRYLFFLEHISQSIQQILFTLRFNHGIRLPDEIGQSLAKLSFLMLLPTNGKRIAVIQARTYFTDMDLYNLLLFFIKLDLAFTHPIISRGSEGQQVRKMLLAYRSLRVLSDALRRKTMRNRIEARQLWMRWQGEIPEHGLHEHVWGVPGREIGRLQYERWGRAVEVVWNDGSRGAIDWRDRWLGDWPGEFLMQPDMLVLREQNRRELGLQHAFMYMLLSGYVDYRWFDNIPGRPVETQVDEEDAARWRAINRRLKQLQLNELTRGGPDRIITDEEFSAAEKKAKLRHEAKQKQAAMDIEALEGEERIGYELEFEEGADLVRYE